MTTALAMPDFAKTVNAVGIGSSAWLAELKRRVGAIGREFEACNKTIANMERKKKGLLKQSKRIWKIIDAESSANAELTDAGQ